MTTKSTITETPSPDMKIGDLYMAKSAEVEYLIVLVTVPPMNPRVATTFTGVVVHSGAEQDYYPIGFHDDGWVIHSFKPYHGTLTLESTP